MSPSLVISPTTSLKLSRKPSAVQASVMMGALHKLVQVTNHSAAAHIQCAKPKVLMLTRQPAFPSCHHLLHISSSLLFLAQCSVEKAEIKQVVTWEMRAALCVGPGIRPPGLLAWGESNTWHLSPHIPFTTNPTPSPGMGELMAFTYMAEKKKTTQFLLVLITSLAKASPRDRETNA